MEEGIEKYAKIDKEAVKRDDTIKAADQNKAGYIRPAGFQSVGCDNFE